MNFTTLYRLSFYLMLSFATLTLSVDVTDSPIALFYPVAVAIAAVVAMLTVDRNPRLGLSRQLSNWLALASIGLVFLEYSSLPGLLLLALAHWLVYLQLIKMFLPKRVEDDWFLFLLGLMQVLVGAVGSQSDHVGLALGGWALSALWVMALFSLHRDALRFRQRPDPGPPGDPEASPEDPYPGLVNAAFLVTALRVTVTTLALGGVIFLAMPRRSRLASLNTNTLPARYLTGFDEEVRLGQLGEILENDSVVMSIELFDAEFGGNRIAPPADPLWRGVTMTEYNNGRWYRQKSELASFPTVSSARTDPRKVIRQQIRLEPTGSSVLFGLRPMLDAASPARSIPEMSRIDGTILRSDPRIETYDYKVVSDANPNHLQINEVLPRRQGLVRLLDVPAAIAGPIRAIAEEEAGKVPAEEPLRRARALEFFLRSSGHFRYSLQENRGDASLDPVVDFLANHRSGHCGYFASALTLMLRSVGIPARMVNGFKGGDWNDLAHLLSVRQKHAHSWVEALIRVDPEAEPTWVTLDPTPGSERNEAVASVGGFVGNFRQITDLIRYIWVFYIVGYNSDRQRFLLYDPIRQLVKEARNGFQMMGAFLQSAASALFVFRDFSAFISVRGFFVSFGVLLGLVGISRLVAWLWRLATRWFGGDAEESGSLSASQVFYRRLAHLLAGIGMERPATETQHEFAHRAGAFLTGRGSSTAGVADVPGLVVDAYYRVRFGHRELTPAALERLERRLDALEASLNANAE